METLLLQELRPVNDYYNLKFQIYYWRTSNQVEVDFILYGELGLFAFEVKRKNQYTSRDLKGLRSFLRDYPMTKAFLLYGGNQEFYEDSITVLPFRKAITQLRKILKMD